MNLFAGLTARITAGMGLLLALVLAMALVGARGIRATRRAADESVAGLAEQAAVSTGLVSAVVGQMRAAQQYLLTPSRPLRVAFVESGDSAYAYQRRFGELTNLTNDDRLVLNRIALLQSEIEVAYALAHAQADLGRADSALGQAARAEAPADSLVASVRQLATRQAAMAQARAAELRVAAGRHQSALWVLFGLAAILGLGTVVVTRRSVARPLRRLVAAAERFGAGDLRPVELSGMPTELSQMAHTLDATGAKLRTIVSEVIREAEHISGSAGDFSSMSEELAASSNEISTAMMKVAESARTQLTGMEQATTMLDGLRAAAATIAEAARQVDRSAEGIRRSAAAHQVGVEAARQTLFDVREVVRASADQVRALAELSTKITAFIDLIMKISDQTNLLALNAAIEAARAGERGRGFAVVADEVRKLATSSARAAEDVTVTVKQLLDQVRAISSTMQTGSGKVEGIGQVAEEAARGLQEIAEAVREIATAAGAVVADAERNRVVVDALVGTTSQAKAAATEHSSASESAMAATEQQTASTEEIAAAATELLNGAHRLTALVADFRT